MRFLFLSHAGSLTAHSRVLDYYNVHYVLYVFMLWCGINVRTCEMSEVQFQYGCSSIPHRYTQAYTQPKSARRVHIISIHLLQTNPFSASVHAMARSSLHRTSSSCTSSRIASQHSRRDVIVVAVDGWLGGIHCLTETLVPPSMRWCIMYLGSILCINIRSVFSHIRTSDL